MAQVSGMCWKQVCCIYVWYIPPIFGVGHVSLPSYAPVRAWTIWGITKCYQHVIQYTKLQIQQTSEEKKR